MPSRKLVIALAACAALAACNKAQESTREDLDVVGNETSTSYNKLRDYLDLGHKDKPVPKSKPVDQRYCYHTYEDIICYPTPIAGEEYRLVGFQTAAGKTGYVLPPATPTPGGEKLAELPPLKSVTVGSPPAVLATPPKPQLKEIIFDPAELQPKELVPDKPQ